MRWLTLDIIYAIKMLAMCTLLRSLVDMYYTVLINRHAGYHMQIQVKCFVPDLYEVPNSLLLLYPFAYVSDHP